MARPGGGGLEQERELRETIGLLVRRLERIPADSPWAHRASGHRGALLRWLERLQTEDALSLSGSESQALEHLIRDGFRFLEAAARSRPFS